MPALRELQQSFVAALFAEHADGSFAHIRAEQAELAGRFDVYRNNLRVGFSKALAMTFPVIERLVGEPYFEQLAAGFLQMHPSRSGNLHHIGAPFPGFLREKYHDSEFAYLADVAELEWAHEEVFVAADDEALHPEALRAVPVSDYSDIHFRLRAAIALIRSDYPILDIWQANQPGAPGDELIDLSRGGQHLLVLRTPECIEFHRLPSGEFAALRAIANGASLGDALEAARAAEATFDLARALQNFFRLRLFTALTTEDTP